MFKDRNIETSKSPDTSVLLQFQKHFDAFDKTILLIESFVLEIDEPAAIRQ